MSALAKIKKSAAQHEHDRQYDKALAQYARLLDDGAGADEDADVALYNHAGDLALRAGDVPRAVAYFERAIDLYAAGGFLNNAVALAVKILRHAPGHLAAHHTLGLLYARKGFRAEARQHLATYAAQMHRAGRAEEVRRALGELAALGAGAADLAQAREALAASAAGPEDAGALVKLLDAALAPAQAATSGARGEPGVAAGAVARAGASPPGGGADDILALDATADVGSPAASKLPSGVRWITGLPDDPAPLRLAALTAMAAPPTAPDVADFDEVVRAVVAEPSAEPVTPATFDALDTFDVPPAFTVEQFAEHAPIDLAPVDPGAADVVPANDVPSSGFSLLELDAELGDATEFGLASEAPTNDLVLLDPDAPALEVQTPAATTADPAAVRHVVDQHTPAAPSSADLDEPADLGEWLRSTLTTPSTRLVTADAPESGDEQADFGLTLQALTAGIAQSVDTDDRESHYDLGVAFREMGLLEDAVRELQRALAAPGSGLREREALAQCFLDLGRPELALATLEDAAADAARAGTAGDTLVGVHYVLAEAATAVGRVDDARAWYVRVLAADYGFRDAATHLAALPPPRPAPSTA